MFYLDKIFADIHKALKTLCKKFLKLNKYCSLTKHCTVYLLQTEILFLFYLKKNWRKYKNKISP